MSNYWDLYCTDCDASAGIRWNHGEKDLSALGPHLAALFRALPALDIIDGNLINHSNIDQTVLMSIATFAGAHGLHEISPRDEYGRLPTECWKSYACDHCGSHPDCKRPLGHDGLCGPKDGPS